jgi:tRNA dimethylallyltransferase
MNHAVVILVGPTAVGKTDLSVDLAGKLDCEIISADSRQIYTHMDIGTAKPDAMQLAAVPHHFISVKNPNENYSAGQYAEEARPVIAEKIAAGKPPVVVGGSGFYIRALVDGFFEPRIADLDIRERLKQKVRKHGLPVLYDRLAEVDPVTAHRLPASDKQRILRALEVYEITGRPFSVFHKMQNNRAEFDTLFIGLTMNRNKLYKRIDDRVDKMLRAGLLQEVRDLLEKGYNPELNALKTVGYQEAIAHLKGGLSQQEMIGLIKQKSRNYAKRQFTWFRKDPRIHWIDLDEIPRLQHRTGMILRLLDKSQTAQCPE